MQTNETIDQLQEKWQAEGVRHALAQFVDIHGVAKGKWVPIEHLRDLIEPGAGFAGPSVSGLGLPRNGSRSEYYARADLASARVLPWQADTVHLICDGYVAGMPFEGCSRQTLRRAVVRLAEMGLRLQVGIEPEFFLLRRDASGGLELPDPQDTLEKPSYDLKSLQRGDVQACLVDLVQHLAHFGFDVLQVDHEDAPGQYEVNYRYGEAMSAADQYVRFKMAAHATAQQHGLVFSAMPKPFADRPGSGLHFHLSLVDTEGVAICAGQDGGLSRRGMHALGGLLRHAKALCALHAPTVNSYKRLVVGQSLSGSTWAPAHIAWGSNNRTTPARVTAGRIEWRVPDPSCNVYLALAAVIHALMDGLENELQPGPALEEDLYDWPEGRFGERGVECLPQSLGEALQALQADSSLIQAIGGHIIGQFVETKSQEWIDYGRQVSAWEWSRYSSRY
jgi:glutamine synthetase